MKHKLFQQYCSNIARFQQYCSNIARLQQYCCKLLHCIDIQYIYIYIYTYIYIYICIHTYIYIILIPYIMYPFFTSQHMLHITCSIKLHYNLRNKSRGIHVAPQSSLVGVYQDGKRSAREGRGHLVSALWIWPAEKAQLLSVSFRETKDLPSTLLNRSSWVHDGWICRVRPRVSCEARSRRTRRTQMSPDAAQRGTLNARALRGERGQAARHSKWTRTLFAEKRLRGAGSTRA